MQLGWREDDEGQVAVRTVAVPHLQTTVAVWMLRLDSELIWDGDIQQAQHGK